MLKPLTSVDYRKLWKIPQEMKIPDHLTCLLRNLYAGHEAIVRSRPNKVDKIRRRSQEYTEELYKKMS